MATGAFALCPELSGDIIGADTSIEKLLNLDIPFRQIFLCTDSLVSILNFNIPLILINLSKK